MINIKVNRANNDHLNVSCKVQIVGKQDDGIAEFEAILYGLRRADKELFRLAMFDMVQDEIDEIESEEKE